MKKIGICVLFGLMLSMLSVLLYPVQSVDDCFCHVDATYDGCSVGQIMMWYNDSSYLPTGWVVCNASNNVLYGSVCPNLMGRAVMGYNSSAGATYAQTLGLKSGNKTHLNTIGELVSHQHSYVWQSIAGATRQFNTNLVKTLSSVSGYTSYVGDGAAYDILNPYMSLYYVVKVS